MATGAGVGIDGLANLGSPRVLELAALADGEEVEAGASELPPEVHGVVDVAARIDHLVTQEADADHVVVAHLLANGGIDLEREPRAAVAVASVPVGAVV